ncbi:MAG: hypothetical protein LH628_12770 [Microcoleus sp. CAN_BIN18]|nr:hypothetical protein [Microcoleus sp. CAN_BIN18]
MLQAIDNNSIAQTGCLSLTTAIWFGRVIFYQLARCAAIRGDRAFAIY